uniref:Uncharacterized protein n=1 Tax=Amphimedon queenslandica TaxID=400682 RepID=A0A1X7UAJ2_AMPQE
EYSIRIFMFGDYEFLCNLYGLSGASGRHCCLWYIITSDKLKVDKTTRDSENTIVPRSLASLSQKHQEFVTAGSNLKRAKFFENVIGKAFFNIPLSQEQSITHHTKIVSKGFDREDGFFVKSLDDALASFNVERKAYYGGLFIGNHIHRALK